MKRLGQLLLAHRRRLAPFVLLGGLLFVGSTLFDAAPRETEIRYDLGPDHGSVVSARIVYLHEGDEVKGARFTYEDGAPAAVRHFVELSPGRYEVRAELSRRDGTETRLRRALRVPADGVVRIELYDPEAVAMGGAR